MTRHRPLPRKNKSTKSITKDYNNVKKVTKSKKSSTKESKKGRQKERENN